MSAGVDLMQQHLEVKVARLGHTAQLTVREETL